MNTEDENNYEFNYGNYDGFNHKEDRNDVGIGNNNRNNKYIIISVVLFIVLAVLVFLLVKGSNSKDPNKEIEETDIVITLDVTSFELGVGEKRKINASINSNDRVIINWISSDERIINVDETGNVTALKEGTATATAIYFDTSNHSYEAKCVITVTAGREIAVDNEKPVIKYNIRNGDNNKWTNKDVTIDIDVTDNVGVTSLKYAFNCVSNCDYIDIGDKNEIEVKDEGTTVVTLVAGDRNNNTATQTITVKIDKTKPTCTLSVIAGEIGSISAKYEDKGGSNLTYYGFNSSYTDRSNELITVSSQGIYSYYVKDGANNTNTCSVEVKSKTQYKYQECAGCIRCDKASCVRRAANWTLVSSNVSSTCTASETTKDKTECVCRTTGGDNGYEETVHPDIAYACNSFLVRKYEKACTLHFNDCDKCGCSSWGNWSDWTDTVHTGSSSKNVTTRVVLY